MNTPVLVVTSVPNEPLAQRMAQLLVERGLAACVHLSPVQSCYRWQGEVQFDQEIKLECKTLRHCYDSVVALLRELHTDELPAIYALTVDAMEPDFQAWLVASVEPLS